jgi:CRISPR-associated protein Csb2
MPKHFCISIRLLNRAFHGRRDRRIPEWPPSPLRLYQSLVAAAARKGGGGLEDSTRSALIWLERKTTSPTIIAPYAVSNTTDGRPCGYLLSVPNNVMDIVGRAWSRGNVSGSGDADPATHRTMKSVRPTYLVDGDTVHFLYPLSAAPTEEDQRSIAIVSDIARSIVALGWGIDIAVGHAEVLSGEQTAALPGARWMPGREGVEGGLRVPVFGTLDGLIERRARFLKRVRSDGTFDPTPPLPESAYRTIEYHRSTDPPRRPIAAFSLLKPDASGFRPFDTARNGLTLTGMLRHAAKRAAQQAGWADSKINAFVLGHRGEKGVERVPVGPKRFAYLPLPSIEGRGEDKARVVGSIRRVMLAAFDDGCEREINWARRALSGQELVNEDGGHSIALLSLLPTSEKIVRCYLEPAAMWATVTPVVLPGYDDPAHYRRRLKSSVGAEEQKRLLERLSDRMDSLLRKAIVQAGFSQELATHAELEWLNVGFWPGTDLAHRYGVPDHLRRFPRVHVRLHWRDAQKRPVPIPGPVCLGGGRFYGLGLFAAE